MLEGIRPLISRCRAVGDADTMRMKRRGAAVCEKNHVESESKPDKTHVCFRMTIFVMFASFFLTNRNVQGCKPCVQRSGGVCRLF